MRQKHLRERRFLLKKSLDFRLSNLHDRAFAHSNSGCETLWSPNQAALAEKLAPHPGERYRLASISSYCLCLHLDQFISNFRADFRFEPDTYQVEQRLGAYAGSNPRFVCDCFGDFRQLSGVPLGSAVGIFKKTPLLPGIYFGMVLGLAIWFWVSRSAWKIVTVLLSTVIAWVAAKFTAEYAFDAIQQMFRFPSDQFYGRRQRGAWGIGRKHYTDVRSLGCVQRIWSV